MRFPLASLANTGAASPQRRYDMKKVEECKEEVAKILQEGLDNHTISKQEMDEALKLQSWEALQPILDKAQHISSFQEYRDELKLVRAERPLMREDFTNAELEQLRELAPEEYDLLK